MLTKFFHWLFPCHFHEPLCADNFFGCRCGKGGETSTTVVSPGSSPSSAEAINAWIAGMPQVYQTQMQYAPQEAAQQVQLAQQYALPLAQAYKTAQETLYPGTSAIQETEANQALAGMNATTMPDWMQKNYMNTYNSQLGTNAGSPIGAEYTSRKMQEQLFNQQKYYRDLGLSLAGRQTLSQPTTPQTTNYASTFTPQNLMSFLASKPVGSTSTTTSGGGGGLFGLF